jgi:hypothetical protein
MFFILDDFDDKYDRQFLTDNSSGHEDYTSQITGGEIKLKSF